MRSIMASGMLLSFFLVTIGAVTLGCSDGDPPPGGTTNPPGTGGAAGSAGGGGQGGQAGGISDGGMGGAGGAGQGGAAGQGGNAGQGGGSEQCGDGTVTGSESCDDHNTVGGDCCSDTCQVEVGCEIEPNDEHATANAFFSLGFGGIMKGLVSPAEDVDSFSFEVPPKATGSVVVETLDGYATTCDSFALDTAISLFDAQGTPLSTADDGGSGFCSKLSFEPLPPGTYYVEVKATSEVDYALSIALAVHTCGDGAVDAIAGEGCDDGNAVAGDGCNSGCQIEPGYACSGAPSVCSAGCGNGVVAAPEICDDGGNTSGDGCSAACATEVGYTCMGAPSACTSVCGDGQRAAGNEACDDGNLAGGDCCDATCQVEPGCEIEPNGTSATANAFQQLAANGKVLGLVDPAGDRDLYAVTIPSGKIGTIVAETGDGFTTTCESLDLDSYIEILDPQGNVVASDDDAASGYCSRSTAVPLAPGDYVVAVSASPVQPSAVFDYSLSIDVTLATCGDGTKAPVEECDDGNTMSGDGCSALCKSELPGESEPNGDAASANGPYASKIRLRGAIVPATDVDFYRITAPSTIDLALETTDSFGPGSCNGIDTVLGFIAADGITVLASDDDSGIGPCSRLEPISTHALRRLPAGTYYVRVESSANASTIAAYDLAIDFVAICGNGIKEGSEQCDGGPQCDDQCTNVPQCGNLVVDANETCDDGNQMSGDGCNAACQLEGPDVEPNNTIAQADARALDAIPVLITGDSVIAGSIGNLADRDVFKMDLGGPAVVRFETFDASGANCDASTTTTIRLLDGAGVEVAADDTSGIASCSALVLNVPAGIHYVQVEETGTDGTLANYELEVNVQASNGTEVEPNDGPSNATPFAGSDAYMAGGHLSGADSDWYALTIPAGKSLRAEIVEGAMETCESDEVDSRLTLYDVGLAELADDDDDGRGYCSAIDGTGMDPVDPGASAASLIGGMYYLEVRASAYASPMSAAEFDYRLAITIR